MLFLFRKWMFSIATGAFLVTFMLSYVFLGTQAEYFAKKQMEVTLNYLKQKISRREFNTKNLQNYYKTNLTEKARVFAFFKKQYPGLLTPAFLKRYIKISGVDQISVLDKQDNYTFSYPLETQDKKIATAIEEKTFENLEYFTINSQQFVGVSVPTDAGIIQIGQHIEKYRQMLKSENISTIAEFLKIGYAGNILIIKDGIIISSNIEKIIGKTLEDIELTLPQINDKYVFFKTVFDKESVFAIITKHNQYVLMEIYPEKELFLRRKNILKWGIPLYLILFLILYLFIVLLLKKLVIKSIQNINDSLSKITAGDLNECVNVTITPEFVNLSSMINSTVNSLKKEIAKTSKSFKQELRFAKEVQFAALPKVFPPFPAQTEFDIFASLHPAKEVSGDFFDFFTIQFNASKLIFFVADVSGKGIPASLFMMSARALIKRYAQDGYSIGKVLNLVNKALCENNTTSMFLTIWMGMLEIDTGILTYVNAGHDLPYFQKQGGPFEELKIESNLPLGVMPDTTFKEHKISLKYGDSIFIYTDGVTDAEDNNKNMYGKNQLKKILNQNSGKTVRDIIKNINENIFGFIKNTAQFDDITMLCLRYQGESKTVPAKIEYEEEIAEFFNSILEKNGCPEEIQNELGIVIDEIFTNIVNYAYPEKAGKITAFCSVGGYPKTIKIQFIDYGIPFNPLNSLEENLDAPVYKREEGHLGIFLVKNLVDQANYEYKKNKNILTLFKKL